MGLVLGFLNMPPSRRNSSSAKKPKAVVPAVTKKSPAPKKATSVKKAAPAPKASPAPKAAPAPKATSAKKAAPDKKPMLAKKAASKPPKVTGVDEKRSMRDRKKIK